MKTEFVRGAKINTPVSASAVVYGSESGVLASQKGLNWFDLVLCSCRPGKSCCSSLNIFSAKSGL